MQLLSISVVLFEPLPDLLLTVAVPKYANLQSLNFQSIEYL